MPTSIEGNTSYDEARAEAFAGGLIEKVNHGALALMISIGHRTQLFDVMAELDWDTSDGIAQKAGLNERYVREWLGAMVTGRVVEYLPANKTYRLPAEHAAYLTRSAGGDNIAQTMQWISVLGNVEDKIIDKFKHGGGVDYCEFHRFHEVMASESDHTVVNALSEKILPIVPELIDRLQSGLRVLKIGCGSGRASCRLAELFPNSTFTAYDLSEEVIGVGLQAKKERHLNNLALACHDLAQLDADQQYDLVLAFDVIHDQKAPALVLENVFNALAVGGTFLMQDVAASSYVEKNMDHVLGPFFYTVSTMHCMTVSLAQGGDGLGAVWG
jgi:2-polyprenyl-3-methyl-5-hydroxy-6-metoxy-1,4-benzoquinol methylase